ncbi:SRPBCC domain-containing protein [Leptospira langatensis]|uniref:SRPBCC domain-containing protein n=1 Tax=Leptospira langatensis TaxID=2484983 RepID=A0A5F1ZPM0_9LEPT|nr:SRPBCC domain-containing protein [Leptospira langatensis]TGK01823.1 SRPBCC domain-containing protein [Leptospira langatensis]TGL39429.1 SRPBCC domain-containing protein [Leptospira langatensis]
MNGIYHKIGIRAGFPEVIKAISTQAGLEGWWTNEVEGKFPDGISPAGETIRFHFGKGSFDMKVQELTSDRVLWECTIGPEEWVGSHIDFKLTQSKAPDGGPMTVVFFKHQDWKRENEMTAHCSMKWAVFLLSLRSLVETGKGQPAPNDMKIDDWN